MQCGLSPRSLFVFRAQRLIPTKRFDLQEYHLIVNFAVIGSTTVWNGGELDMANDMQ